MPGPLQHILRKHGMSVFWGPCAQGSEHAAFLRRRALWFWLQALQMILYVVIVVLCVASPHNFSGDTGWSAAIGLVLLPHPCTIEPTDVAVSLSLLPC